MTCTHPYPSLTDMGVVIDKDTTELPPDSCLMEAGEGSLGFGTDPDTIDWERFWDILDTQHGYNMQDLGGTIHNKIQRKVRAWNREGELGW